jgi:hypothetical protein
MTSAFCTDTGFRSPDWEQREDWQRRLDYHDDRVVWAVDAMLAEIREACRRIEAPDDWMATRNILALLLRRVCTERRHMSWHMSADVMRSVIYSLADQAYREDRIRQFNAEAYRTPKTAEAPHA